MTTFLIRFVLFSGLFYLIYTLLFKHFSFFKTNRSLLLIIPLVSILIPLVAPYFNSPIQAGIPTFELPEIGFSGDEQISSIKPGHNSTNWLLITYMSIALIFLTGLIRGLIKGYKLLRNAKGDTPVYYSSQVESPFTFFNAIVIPQELAHNQNIKTIINHEQVHVNQRHGLDNLYYGILTGLAWFNPFIHLLSQELKKTHECLADEQALKNTSREEYAKLLLSSAFGSEINLSPMAMGTANPFFNSSLIKTRITMMYKQKTKHQFKWLYLALLPLLAGMTIVSCNKSQDQAANTAPSVPKAEVVLNLGDADSPPLFENCDAGASNEEQMSCFTKGVFRHVQENFKYPEAAYKLGLEGKMLVSFVIDQTGEVTQADISGDLVGETEAEKAAVEEAVKAAKELIESLPKLAPAMKEGKKVSVSFKLPLNLKLK